MKSYQGKKVLVTGGAGFIGSHVVEKLVELKAHVTVLDNLSTGNKENLTQISDKITFIDGDIRNQNLCMEALEGCSVVFHLAAQVSVPESVENPRLCFETNVTGTFNLLEAARQHNIERFIFSSSCAVYGDQGKPCDESLECRPSSPYAWSKLSGEQLCRQYSETFMLPTVCLRYFNVFGPRQHPHSEYSGVIAKFTERMKHGHPITIFGDGRQTRDFVPVEQVVHANLASALLAPELCTGEPINVATGISRSILELFTCLKDEFGYEAEPLFEPARTGEITHSQADCRRYRQLLQA